MNSRINAPALVAQMGQDSQPGTIGVPSKCTHAYLLFTYPNRTLIYLQSQYQEQASDGADYITIGYTYRW